MDWPCCNVCQRSFPTRRALGGHMRIHALPNSDKKPMRRYGFRENPKKTWKLMEKEIDMLCSKCGGKHTKYHSETEGDLEFEEKEMNWNSNRTYISDSEVTENEQTAGAFCLMLLSRAPVSVTDSSDKASVVTDDEVEKNKSTSGFPNCDSEMNELAVIPCVPKFDFGINEHEKIQSFPSKSEKKRKYNCETCCRTFSTYQALGGHRASHKKLKVLSFSEAIATEELEIQNHESRSYECSICGRVFASGQALGGHKRSHIVAAKKRKSSDFGTLDLNLPAMEDENYDEMIEDSIRCI